MKVINVLANGRIVEDLKGFKIKSKNNKVIYDNLVEIIKRKVKK